MLRIGQLLALGLTLISTTQASSSVLDLISDNFDEVVFNAGKPALVEFFAPWCGHCKNLAPVWEELAAGFSHASDKVTVAKVDADSEKDLGKRFGVQGFPTLKWFDEKNPKGEDYKGGRDLESLTKFITDKTGIKSKAKKAAISNVEFLNDNTFSKQVGADKHVLVAFTAPWCGHCKSLAPIWEKLADDYASEPNVLIAKVDAEAPNAKRLASDQGVKSYPTIKYFPAGSTEPSAYEGARSESALVTFMNEKASTHRVAGGGLTSVAGTIEALDTLVKSYTGTPETLASVSESINAAAKGASDTYAAYYVKVLEKIGSKGTGYVEKESLRIKGLLAKGGLTPEKMDDLAKRSNILHRFADAVQQAVGAGPGSGKEEL